ncbi:SusC/RagA family TonB-linked outer membrane protein [uncultured Dokdonia sp.]|uniref:SusC/RagA family TonB-linked outer membrane protein n=1 Tax=uncultured Dokdonia sp. TaxID=575653 RepID=UPI0030EB4ED5|tara:strand:+ start:13314 stop:16526 length:3213 start_codon:yes stop_codon:yes gene_type:complete
MKTKFSGILTLLLAFVVQVSFAQTTVSGTVTEENGPLPGANVIIKGTSTGTQTDFDGNYSIQASATDVLVFSFVGFTTKEVTVGGQTTINVGLAADNALEEVIVTAQGIKREKKALGYAVSEIASEAIQENPASDVARVLSGKASGVQITSQSGIAGSATNVIIRGLSSFSQSNQALFIVDGVPFDSSTNSNGGFTDGNNGSSRFLDLDPNNIESVNVLKGLAASTLYGSAGRNGVILITTKGGSTSSSENQKSSINVTQSVFFTDIASLPDYQNEYGGGFDQAFGWFFSNWGPSFSPNGPAGYLNDPSGSIDENGTVAHPYSTAAFAADFPEFDGARYEFRPYDSVERFFRTGVNSTTSINARGGNGDVNYNMNYGRTEETGFTPGNKLSRNAISLGGNAKLSNNFRIAGTLNWTRTNFKSPPVAASGGSGALGNGSSIFGDVFYTPRNVDIQGLPFEDPVTGASRYYRQNNSIQHPLWTVKNAVFSQETNRAFGSANVFYDLSDDLVLNYRFGLDTYSENNVNSQNKGGVGGSTATQNGIYQTWNNTNNIYDNFLSLSGNYDLTDDIGFSFNVGGTSKFEEFIQNGVSSSGQNVFGVLAHFNFNTYNPIEDYRQRNIVGVFAQTSFDYKNLLFVELAARTDWVSNLDVSNRNITYPSASLSFIPTQAFPGLKGDNGKGLNYLKLRAGYGTSAGFATDYPVAQTLVLETQAFQNSDGENVVSNTTSTILGNPNLKPERVDEIEIGLETKFFDNRVTLDVSAYTRSTVDLIVNQPLDPASGFTSTSTNIGEIQTKGIEADLGVNIFRAADENGFSWNSSVNFTTNTSEVKDLGNTDTEEIVFAGFSNRGNAARVGEVLGVMVGSTIARDDAGNFIVDSQGSYIENTENSIIGNPLPDFTTNFINSFSYKNFTLGVQVNWTQGGDIYTETIAALLGRGLTTDIGDRENTYILPGVREDGTVNNIQINNSDYYFSNLFDAPDETKVYDATVVRLQEVSFGYSIPQKFLEKTPFGSISITARGNNLWYNAPNVPKGTNFDPNVAGLGVGNGSGFDYLNGPSAKQYGISVNASF